MKPGESHMVCSPLSVPVSKAKKFIININNMRTTHYRVQAKAKRVYTQLMRQLLSDCPIFGKVEVEFVMFPGSMRKMDLDNVCGGHAKYFLDALQEWGKLEDDNYNYVKGIHYYFGEVQKDNPRVEVTITEYVSERQEEKEGVRTLGELREVLESLSSNEIFEVLDFGSSEEVVEACDEYITDNMEMIEFNLKNEGVS